MGSQAPRFIDIFAGAGGLSLGLMMAGWNGLFAIEKSPMAFQTLQTNLVGHDDQFSFAWPQWLPQQPMTSEQLLHSYSSQLHELKNIDLMAGGPPCQGFSNSGRRSLNDERNRLFMQYLEIVRLITPKMLLVENVQGFARTFTKTKKGKEGLSIEDEQFNADKELQHHLRELGYLPFTHRALRAKDFGVPQLRPRYFMIAIRQDLLASPDAPDPFQILYQTIREAFLKKHGLPIDRPVTLWEAISDLEKKHGDQACVEPNMHAFRQGCYGPLYEQNAFQKLMRRDRKGKSLLKGLAADSHRFARHRSEIEARFLKIISSFRPGLQLCDQDRKLLGLQKHRIALLAANAPCHTLTSLPDDLIHYSEPRIPTVREYARIQSFPDWFEFKSKYTTGGKNRRTDVPRYTQVANAVPPLIAEIMGETLQVYLSRITNPIPNTLI